MDIEAQTAADHLVEKLSQLADSIGPSGRAALETSLAAIRLEAISYLVIGAICGAVAVVLARWWIMKRVWPWFKKAALDDKGELVEPSFLFVFAGAALIPFFFALSSLINCANIYNWISAISPQAGLALRILN